MFRFWSSDSRGSKAIEPAHDSLNNVSEHLPFDQKTSESVAQPHKRRRQDDVAGGDALSQQVEPKRAKLEESMQEQIGQSLSVMDCCETAEERIESAFQLQILIKHEEKRLIDLQLAKCQAALEQLRRVHLKPYPVNCPTPQQMLDVSAGKGYALQKPGAPAPRYAPPFGVVDGPYSRHYERWLIPHADFDGLEPVAASAQLSQVPGLTINDGRATRNYFSDGLSTRGRPSRGVPSAKLQTLSGDKPAKKGTSGPCILKRSDGQTVKLVCLYCERSDFNSTQGFINHVRIAHKHEFKSHDEAAMKSGRPLDPGDADGTAATSAPPGSLTATSSSPGIVDERAPAVQAPRHAVFVNPLARDDMTYQEACLTLSARLADTLKAYNEGKLPLVRDTKSQSASEQVAPQEPSKVQSAADAPYLSRLMQRRKFSGNLQDLVRDAKTKISIEDITPGEESEDGESSAANADANSIPTRTPVVKRVPARSGTSPGPTPGRPTSSKGRIINFPSTKQSDSDQVGRGSASDDDDDVVMEEPSLSPSTLISNNAPSLVSDDGDYDDSDEGSSVSGRSEGLDDARSVSDVAEINLDDENESRTLRRTSTGISSAVRLRKEDPKHVSFVSPMTNSNTEGRKRKA
jgi:ADA HAT complex component 1